MHDPNPRLTRQEQKILEGIEAGLRGDASLDRRLRSLGHTVAGAPGRGGTRGGVPRPRLGWVTAVLGIACVALFLLAAASSSSGPLWLFAAAWVVTAVCLMRLILGAVARRRGAAARRRAD
ncbi:hypothetical protein J3A78_006798 [Streptomyces sp. PvR006]|uniref:DUF3040 domain-containing protein n=1 Tax=Streptomyces sp. PvR006 TaxID=2817860 RepID=UPI001AE150F3|nr:DUF3040 domain-containing protein [Streptomyces sp. PvR006]MBP2586320.1 hypothetical protein [Streptomyces sp. PvR006]